jgi:two-component sensor histidine kinase
MMRAPDVEPREWKRFLADLHHRLNNNLQMITSVIALQQSRTTDPQASAALRATHNRVRAISGTFGPNSTPDLAIIHFGDYLALMIRELASGYGVVDRVEIQIRTTDIAVDMHEAISLALIANELAANALDHAFPENARGKICVTLSYATESADASKPAYEYGVLEVEDNGIPLPAAFDFETAESTGLYLVRTLTSQLGATMTLEERAGRKTFRLTFPVQH